MKNMVNEWSSIVPYAPLFEHLLHKFIIDAPLAYPHNMQCKSRGIITSDICFVSGTMHKFAHDPSKFVYLDPPKL